MARMRVLQEPTEGNVQVIITLRIWWKIVCILAIAFIHISRSWQQDVCRKGVRQLGENCVTIRYLQYAIFIPDC